MLKNGKKDKIFKNLGKNVQNLKNILKLGRWFHAIIGRNKLLKKAPAMLRQVIPCKQKKQRHPHGTHPF